MSRAVHLGLHRTGPKPILAPEDIPPLPYARREDVTAARAGAQAYASSLLAPLYLTPQAEPAAPATGAVLYVDEADGIVKIKYANGNKLELAS